MESARQLEWELSLSSSELISHGWYRGAMGRAPAEAELHDEGHFLVRDSASQPGNYVLSCKHNGQYLHFVINRVVIQPETVYERFQYQFEDEAYDTVPDLVTSYVGSGKPISMASGAKIQRPANRTYPLTSCYPVNQSMSHSGSKSSDLCKDLRTFSSKYNSLDRSHRNPIHTGEDVSYSADGSSQGVEASMVALSLTGDVSFHAYRRKVGETDEEGNDCGNPVKALEQTSWESWESVQANPPAKPARMQQPGYQTSGSDSGNGSGDSHSSGPGDTLSQYSTTRPIHGPFKPQIHFKYAEENVMKTSTIEFDQVSCYNVENFSSVLFATNHNKPLESDALQTIKALLRTSGPRILANHMTTIDLRLFFGEKNKNEENCNLLDSVTGLELCLLPHGQRMRLDVIERVECMKLLIAVTILTCQTDIDRAEVLNDWIQLAIEVKTALGNLFGFSVIMLGLCMPQIECLEAMWFKLRQKYTDAAFTFEAKLRPCFKSMNEGTDPAPPNTTIPHLLPTVLLIQNADLFLEKGKTDMDTSSSTSADFGLSTLASHMEMARKYPEQIPTYRQNARTVVQELSSLGTMFDPNILELFQTEFHIRFLWGSKGANIAAHERHNRLSQVLTAMAQKYPSQASD